MCNICHEILIYSHLETTLVYYGCLDAEDVSFPFDIWVAVGQYLEARQNDSSFPANKVSAVGWTDGAFMLRMWASAP